jgi:pyridoxine kinase
MKANGSGDVTAALFTAHYVRPATRRCARAHRLERSTCCRLTYESGERELQLVEAQEFYANPRLQFAARRVR